MVPVTLDENSNLLSSDRPTRSMTNRLWSSLRSTISNRPQRVFNALGHLITNEGYDEGKRLQTQL